MGGGVSSLDKPSMVVRREGPAAISDPVAAQATEHRIGAQFPIDVDVAGSDEVGPDEFSDGEFGGQTGVENCPPVILSFAQ